MGSMGYDGKLEVWEAEDIQLAAKGIQNPWERIHDERARNWLRGRSKLEVTDGNAEIKWRKPATQKVSEEMEEKQSHAEALGISWVRENDLLSSCLGPEPPGRVSGVSSSMGWKHAWPQFSDMYRKRRRIESVDLQAMKEDIKAQVTQEIMAMFASQGLKLQPLSKNPSRRSSCASASEVGEEANDADRVQMDIEDVEPIADLDRDSIDVLTDPTPCSLVSYYGGQHVEVAWGQVYPQQTVLHTVPILDGYAVVKVEFVHSDFNEHVLVPPPNDETITLSQALLQRIQWKRSCIVVKPMDGSGAHKYIKKDNAGSAP